jgi:hypothetical protein
MSILLDKNKHDSNTKMGSTEDSIPLDHDNDESDYAVSPSLQATTKSKYQYISDNKNNKNKESPTLSILLSLSSHL